MFDALAFFLAVANVSVWSFRTGILLPVWAFIRGLACGGAPGQLPRHLAQQNTPHIIAGMIISSTTDSLARAYVDILMRNTFCSTTSRLPRAFSGLALDSRRGPSQSRQRPRLKPQSRPEGHSGIRARSRIHRRQCSSRHPADVSDFAWSFFPLKLSQVRDYCTTGWANLCSAALLCHSSQYPLIAPAPTPTPTPTPIPCS
ncbi:hypothetical protein EDB80DRAFT_681412 [Ilyonectria destructans]|nr:hypothetical protein EDB80DRAFT_681412 [Ilyonectria destructans]